MTVRWYDSLASTMDSAHQAAESGAAHGTAVAAREQVAGRGRRGRPWASPHGGLWMSVVCRPPADAISSLSLRVGLALAEELERLVPGIPPLQVKWPNDLFIEGRKLGGLLCEARWESETPAWVVVGLGLNVANQIPPDLEARATGLGRFVHGVRPEDLAGPLAAVITRVAATAGPLRSAELETWNRRDALKGRRLTAPLGGIASGITPDGRLLITSESGLTTAVRSGEAVTFE